MYGFTQFKYLGLEIKRENTSLCFLVFVQLLPLPCQEFFQEGTAGNFDASQWHSIIKRDESKITSSYCCCYSDCCTYHFHPPPNGLYEGFPGVQIDQIHSSWWHISHLKQMLHSPVNFSIFTSKVIFFILTLKETRFQAEQHRSSKYQSLISMLLISI